MADRDKEMMNLMGGNDRMRGTGGGRRNDDGDVPLTATFKDSTGRNVSTTFQGQRGSEKGYNLAKLQERAAYDPPVINVDGKQKVFLTENWLSNPGIPRQTLTRDDALGGWLVDAASWQKTHPSTPNFDPRLAFGLASAGLGAVAGAGALAGAGGPQAGLSGALASPESVSGFLGTVPEAVGGTQLPIGGSLLDITAPGALEAAGAAGNLITPGGAPSSLPGAAGEPGAPATPAEAPAIPATEGGAVTPPATPTTGAEVLNRAPVVDLPAPQPVTSATTPAISGAPVGGGGVQAGAPVAEIGRPASLVDQARIGGGSLLNRAITTAAKNPLAVGGLGLNLFAQSNAKKQGKQLDDELRAAGADADRIAKSLTTQGLSGQPSASSAHEINQWEQNQIGAIKQRYANMGRDPSNDSAAAKELGDVTAKAVAMRDAAARGLLSQGLQASQIAQGPATNAALAAARRDKEFAASMGSVLQALAQIQAMENRSAPAAPGTP